MDPKYTYMDDPLPDAAYEEAIAQTTAERADEALKDSAVRAAYLKEKALLDEQEDILTEGIQALIQEANEAITRHPPSRLRFASGGRLASKRSVRKGLARRAAEVQRYVARVLKEAVRERLVPSGGKAPLTMSEMEIAKAILDDHDVPEEDRLAWPYSYDISQGKVLTHQDDTYGRGKGEGSGKMNQYVRRKV